MSMVTMLRKLMASNDELDRREREAEAARHHCRSAAACQVGQKVELFGTVSSVMASSRDRAAMLVATLDDGTRAVELRWLGRRRIAGVDAGRRLLVRGRLVKLDGVLVLMNPAYDLEAPED